MLVQLSRAADEEKPADSEVDPHKKSKLTSDRSEKKSDRRKLLLTTGEDKVVDLDFDANLTKDGISVGNPKTVFPQLIKIDDKRQLVLKPLAEGDTTITVRDTEGNLKLIFDVTVTPNDLLEVAAQLRTLLKGVEGIEISVIGKRVIIDGEVMVPADYGRIVNVLTQDKSYKALVSNLTTLSPVSLQILAKKIQSEIITFAPNVRVRVVNSALWLEGTVDSAAQANRAQIVAELYVPQVKPLDPIKKDTDIQELPGQKLVNNFLVINPPPPKREEKLVRMTVHFVELAKDYNKLFGFKWQPGFTSDDPRLSIGTGATGEAGISKGASFSATISSLFPRLQSAQSAGFARILKTGSLIVRNREPASLTDETEIPFAVSSGNGQVAADKARVGTQFSATPNILGQSENIQIEVVVKQNNLTGRSGDVPIVSSHQVNTKIDVRSKESAAIGGLMSSDVRTSFNKDDPRSGSFQGPTSPLFTLLRSKNYEKTKSQFVIFITPEIVDNASDGTEDLRKNFRVKVR